MAAGTSILQRMSGREKRFIGALVALAFIGAGAFSYVYLGDAIAVLEEELLEGQDAMAEIRERARDYLDSQRRKQALEDAIKENDPKIQTAIDSIARKVEVSHLKGSAGEESSMDKVLTYEAKTNERGIYLGEQKGKKKKKKDRASDFIELSQPAGYSFVKFVDLVRFLEQVESPERLMYVSKLVLTKKYGAPEYVQGKLTISTFIYKPQDEE